MDAATDAAAALDPVVLARDAGCIGLGPADGEVVVELEERPDALPPPRGGIVLASAAERHRVVARLAAGGHRVEETPAGHLVRDASADTALLRI